MEKQSGTNERNEMLQMLYVKTARTFFGCTDAFSHIFLIGPIFLPPIKCLGKKLLLITTVEGKKKEHYTNLRHFSVLMLAFLLTHTSIEKFPRSQANIYFSYYKCIRMFLCMRNVRVCVCASTHTSFG